MKKLFNALNIKALQPYLKGFRFNSIFVRNFRMILLMLVVPIILLVVVIYNYNIKILRQDIVVNNKNTIIKIRSDMDKLIETNTFATLKLSTSIDVLSMAGINEIDRNYSTILLIDRIQRQIKDILISNSSIEDILISFKKTNYFIASDSSWTSYDNGNLREIPFESIRVSLSDDNRFSLIKHGNNIYFVGGIYEFNKFQGLVIVKSSVNVINHMLGNILQTSSSTAFIIDENNKIFAGNKDLYTIISSNRLISALPTKNITHESSNFVNLNGIENILSMVNSSNFKIRYILMTPALNYHRSINNMKIMLILPVILSLIITLLASWIITYKLYHPIQIIIEALNDSYHDIKSLDKNDYKKLDEVGYISGSIKNTQNENVLIRTELKNKNELLKRAQTIALQAQINPHFLNNTLESINWRALELIGGQNDISLMLKDLSLLLRMSLDSKSHLVCIADEISHSQLYIKIQKYRFKDKFSVDWDIDGELFSYNTIKLTLQPLLENVITHGIKDAEEPIKINVRCCSDGDNIQFLIGDNGQGIDKANLERIKQRLISSTLLNSDHIGLLNVNERVQLAFGTKYGIDINSAVNVGTQVIMTIPKVK